MTFTTIRRILLILTGVPLLLLVLWVGLFFEETTSGKPGTATRLAVEAGAAALEYQWQAQEARLLDGESTAATITLARDVRLADLLSPGEAPPAPALHELWAEARAGSYMQGECERALKTIAQRCVVARSRAEPLGDGRYRITARLDFAPVKFARAPAGEASADRSAGKGKAALTHLRVRLTAMNTEQIPEALYRKAQASCEKAARKHGACIVRRIELDRHPDATDGTTGAEAILAVFAAGPAAN